MMKVLSLVAALLPCAWSAPALVWTNNRSEQPTIHDSEEVTASDLIRRSLCRHNMDRADNDDNDFAGAVFLLGRSDADGKESVTHLASQSKLQGIASKYDAASSIHHSVSGMDAASTLEKAASSSNAMTVSLEEFQRKLDALERGVPVEGSSKRERQLQSSRVLVVAAQASEHEAFDEAVVRAIDSASVPTVIAAGQRSTAEVKRERDLYYRQRQLAQERTGDRRQRALTERHESHRNAAGQRRRLEENNNNNNNGENNGEDNNGNNNGQDLTGIYYVSMTPNILAGLLFTFLFATVTAIGVNCMGMISGQTVYVSKMPSVGREA